MSVDTTTTAPGTNIDDSAVSVYKSYLEKQLLAGVYCFIGIAGVVGNSSVLLAGMFSRQTRSTTNVFVFNMAAADLVTCLSLPITVLAMLSPSQDHLPVSDGVCSFQAFVIIVCIGCSINNIACIAFYRAVITSQGNAGRPLFVTIFNPRILVLTVCTSWIIPVSVGLLPVVSEFGSYGYETKFSTCSFSPTSQGSDTFSKIMIASFYPVQLVVTFTSYASVFFVVRKHARRVNLHPPVVVAGNMRPPGQSETRLETRTPSYNERSTNQPSQSEPASSVLTGPLAPTNHPPRRHNQQSRRNLTVTLNMLLVLVCFIVCITPYSMAIVFAKNRSQKFIPFLGSLVVSNSCINPVIYITRNPDFKKVCRCILLCRLADIPKKSALLRRLLSLRKR